MLPSGEAETGTQQTGNLSANKKLYAIKIKASRDLEDAKRFAVLKEKGMDKSYPGSWVVMSTSGDYCYSVSFPTMSF